MHKLRVGVFMGSQSIEREVSFNSGRTVCDHLDTEKYSVIPIFQDLTGNLYILPWRFLYRGKIKDFEHRLEKEAQKIYWDDLNNLVDFIYIASHGQYAEDGTLQGVLELLNIPYLGSKVLSSAICMDKIIQKDILNNNNILTPKSINLETLEIKNLESNINNLFNKLQDNNISLPVVVKPQKSGSSLGIEIVDKKDNLLSAIKKASNIEPHKSQAVLIEEFIAGLEFTCIVITDSNNKDIALPPTEIVPENNSKFFDYKQKYMPGCATKFTPARCSKEQLKAIQDSCIKVKNILEIENIARIDGFLTPDNKIIITDPNTLAGMAPSSFIFRQAAEVNMSHTDFINHLIKTELKKYNMLNTENKNSTSNKNQNQDKLKVAVILGGPSNEKEISLESGRNIIYKLSPNKYTAIPLFLDNKLKLYKIDQRLLVRNSTKEIIQDLKPEMLVKWNDLPKITDFVFIGLHGAPGENGVVQSMLEMLKIPYNGSSILTSALCMDKYKTNKYLKTKNFEVPESKLITKSEWVNNKNLVLTELQKIGFPSIVKPHDDGCSFFVKKVNNIKELDEEINKILSTKNKILVEEFIKGIELTVGIVGNDKPYALPPSQTVVSKDILSIEEKFLPGAGENQTPAPLPLDILNLVKDKVEKCYKTLNCKGYARIDCFYQTKEQSKNNKERVVILEVNTLPGMTPATCIFHQAAEINLTPMEFIDLIIELGLKEHTKQNFEYNNNKIKIKEFTIS